MAEIVITPHLLLTYHLVDDYVARRAPLRQAHIALVTEMRRQGQFVMGGAVGDPPHMALLVFKAVERAEVEKFVSQDPYAQNGLVTRWDIQPWAAVTGEALDAAQT